MCDCENSRTPVYREDRLLARRPHYCVECEAMILPGQRYSSHHGLTIEGTLGWWWRANVCFTCQDLWNRLRNLPSDVCYCFGNLRAAVQGALDEEGFVEVDSELAAIATGVGISVEYGDGEEEDFCSPADSDQYEIQF